MKHIRSSKTKQNAAYSLLSNKRPQDFGAMKCSSRRQTKRAHK